MKKFVIAFALAALLQACATSSFGPVSVEREQASRQQLDTALGHLRDRQLPEAQLAINESLKLNPGNAQSHHVAALIYQQLGQTRQAQDHFQMASELLPTDPVLRNNYGNFLCTLGKYAAAEDNFTAAANSPVNAAPDIAYTNAGLCALRNRRGDQARQYFETALQKNPGQVTALYQLARLNLQAGNLTAADRLLDQYQQYEEHTAKTLLLKAQIEHQLGNIANVQRYQQLLQERFPNTPESRQVSDLVLTPVQPRRYSQPSLAPSAESSGTDWLLSREPTRYTLQILATQDETAIDRLLAIGELPEKTVSYSFRGDDQVTWFNLVMGDYASLDQARLALQALPPAVRDLNPWVRRFDSIQRVISRKGN